jgi:hypothetical protein
VQTALTTGIDESAIDTWVQDQIANAATSGWPSPDAQTAYIVYVPDTVKVTSQGADACTSSFGYHVELEAGANPNGVSYGLILEQCYTQANQTLMQNATATAAHEIAEATTDPYPNNDPALHGFDSNHLGWALWNDWQDEVGDLCQYFDEVYFQGGSDEPYLLCRLWSNASGAAGHDPCVPVPTTPYNNVTPLGLQDVSVQAVGGDGTVATFATKGWRIAPGQSANVTVGFYSDAPTGAWTVQAVEGDCCTSPWTSVLTITPSTFSGKNGDKVQLGITVNNAPTQGTAALLTFWSDAGNKQNHYMPVVVATY